MDESPGPSTDGPAKRQKRVQPSRSTRGGPGVGTCDTDKQILDALKRKWDFEASVPENTPFLLTTDHSLIQDTETAAAHALALNPHINERYFDRPEVMKAYRTQKIIETPEFTYVGDEPGVSGRLRHRGNDNDLQDPLSDAVAEKRFKKYEAFEKRIRLREKEKLKHDQYKLKERIEQLRGMESAAYLSLPASSFSAPPPDFPEVTDETAILSHPLDPKLHAEGERRRKEMLAVAAQLEAKYRQFLPPDRLKKNLPSVAGSTSSSSIPAHSHNEYDARDLESNPEQRHDPSPSKAKAGRESGRTPRLGSTHAPAKRRASVAPQADASSSSSHRDTIIPARNSSAPRQSKAIPQPEMLPPPSPSPSTLSQSWTRVGTARPQTPPVRPPSSPVPIPLPKRGTINGALGNVEEAPEVIPLPFLRIPDDTPTSSLRTSIPDEVPVTREELVHPPLENVLPGLILAEAIKFLPPPTSPTSGISPVNRTAKHRGKTDLPALKRKRLTEVSSADDGATSTSQALQALFDSQQRELEDGNITHVVRHDDPEPRAKRRRKQGKPLSSVPPPSIVENSNTTNMDVVVEPGAAETVAGENPPPAPLPEAVPSIATYIETDPTPIALAPPSHTTVEGREGERIPEIQRPPFVDIEAQRQDNPSIPTPLPEAVPSAATHITPVTLAQPSNAIVEDGKDGPNPETQEPPVVEIESQREDNPDLPTPHQVLDQDSPLCPTEEPKHSTENDSEREPTVQGVTPEATGEVTLEPVSKVTLEAPGKIALEATREQRTGSEVASEPLTSAPPMPVESISTRINPSRATKKKGKQTQIKSQTGSRASPVVSVSTRGGSATAIGRRPTCALLQVTSRGRSRNRHPFGLPFPVFLAEEREFMVPEWVRLDEQSVSSLTETDDELYQLESD